MLSAIAWNGFPTGWTGYQPLNDQANAGMDSYIVFFSLPLIGLKFSSGTAAVIALSIHLGAYATEILRAGVESIPKGQWEAARSTGIDAVLSRDEFATFEARRKVFHTLPGLD